MRRVRHLALACVGLLCAAHGAAAAVGSTAAQTPDGRASHVVVIVGLGGDHDNAERFHAWAVRIVDAARGRYGVPASHVVYLGDDPARDPARLTGRATRDTISRAFTDLAARARPGDRVLIVLIGHGASATPGAARFNISGPDVSASEFARLLDHLAAQSVTFVNTASASGGFLAALAGTDRTIITATRTEAERNQTRFGGFFGEALESDDADNDKDGRISMLEAFVYTRARVSASYEQDGQLLTEHAMLDDNGDGTGTDTPGQPGGDGALARTQFLSGGAASGTTTDSPELRALLDQRSALETRLAALKEAKASMDASQYQRDLEALLLELARVGRAIREKRQ
jgi:hypothetical protein